MASGKMLHHFDLPIGALKFFPEPWRRGVGTVGSHPENVPTKNLSLYKVDFKVKRTRKKIYFSPIQDNLSQNLVDDDFTPGMEIDFSKIFLMTHSSGGHVLINYLKVSFLEF